MLLCATYIPLLWFSFQYVYSWRAPRRHRGMCSKVYLNVSCSGKHTYACTHYTTLHHTTTYTVFCRPGEAPAHQKWSLGTTWLPIQSRNQTGRRQLWLGLQRYTFHGHHNSTSPETQGQNDKGREMSLHSGHQTSQRCTYWIVEWLNVLLPSRLLICNNSPCICMWMSTHTYTHAHTHARTHAHTHTCKHTHWCKQEVQIREKWRTS